jgi:hypothetical protein
VAPAGPVKDEAPTLAAEQSHNERHTRADVFLINIQRVIVDVEHGIIQLIDGQPSALFLGARRSGLEHDSPSRKSGTAGSAAWDGGCRPARARLRAKYSGFGFHRLVGLLMGWWSLSHYATGKWRCNFYQLGEI